MIRRFRRRPFIGTHGAAAARMRPIVELMFVDFFGVCMDDLQPPGKKYLYVSGNISCVVVLTTAIGGGTTMRHNTRRACMRPLRTCLASKCRASNPMTPKA